MLSFFKKKMETTFTLLIIFIVKSLQKEQNSTNLLLWSPICQNKPTITPKWFNSLDTNSKLNSISCARYFISSFFPKSRQAHVFHVIAVMRPMVSGLIRCSIGMVGQKVTSHSPLCPWSSAIPHFLIRCSISRNDA